MLTPTIDYRYLRSTRPNDARLITNPSPNKSWKKPHKHAQPPNKNNKIRPSGGGELGEGGGQTERTVINWLAKARLFIKPGGQSPTG